jgi:SP family galactose:H+ symporter-like MFS transporter
MSATDLETSMTSRSRAISEFNNTANVTPFPQPGVTRWLLLVLIVLVLAGVLFGYDQGVTSAALPGLQQEFSLSLLMTQVVTSWVTLGAMLGSLLGGELGDRIGRRDTAITAALMFTVGAAVQFFAPGIAVLVMGRLIVGGGVGIAAVVAPLYASETAPQRLRGRFVSGYQLAITAGIFLAYVANGLLSEGANWRLMLGAAAVPGFALLLFALFASESPRWLVAQGRRQEAELEIRRLEPTVNAKKRVEAISRSLAVGGSAASWSELLQCRWRRSLSIALGLAVFQQITGINAIIYYANQIFSMAGIASPAAQATITIWAIGAVNMLASVIATAFIDSFGRRFLLLVGLAGMGASLVAVGIAFHFATSEPSHVTASASILGAVTVASLVACIFSFALSLGPVTWAVISEVFPAHLRSRGVALATAVNWASGYLVSHFFLSRVADIGISNTFWLLALCCLTAWAWIYQRLPETRGRSLEQIQDQLAIE